MGEDPINPPKPLFLDSLGPQELKYILAWVLRQKRVPLSLRREQMTAVFANGVRTAEGLAELTGLAVSTVRQYAGYFGITLDRSVDPTAPKAVINQVSSIDSVLDRLEATYGAYDGTSQERLSHLLPHLPPYFAERLFAQVRTHYRFTQRKHITEQERDALEKACILPFSNLALAYFAGRSYQTIKKLRAGKNVETTYLVGNRNGLSYPVASEVYYAADHGFTREEITSMFKLPEDTVQFAFEHRDAVSGKIIGLLQTIWPGKTSEKPYITVDEFSRRFFECDVAQKRPSSDRPYRKRGATPKPLIDAHVDDGLTLEELRTYATNPKTGKPLTRERVRQYLRASGQEERRKEAKRRREVQPNSADSQLRSVHQSFVAPLANKMLEKAGEESWAVQQALRYDLQRQERPGNVPLQTLIRLYETYDYARRNGQKVSYETLAEIAGLRFASRAKRFLDSAGCPSLYWTAKQIVKTTEEQERAIRRAFATPFTNTDIAFFTRTTPVVVNSRYSNKERERRDYLHREGRNGRKLTYHLASEIYQAQDLGFSGEECAQLFDTELPLITYALDHKKEISKVIVEGLRKMYGRNRVRMPYLTKENMPEQVTTESRREQRKMKHKFVEALRHRVLRLAESQSPAVQDAILHDFYRRKHTFNEIPVHTIAVLYETYDAAKAQSEKLSYAELGKRFGISLSVVHHFCNATGRYSLR